MNATRYFGVAAVVVIIEGGAAFDIRIKFIAEELAAVCCFFFRCPKSISNRNTALSNWVEKTNNLKCVVQIGNGMKWRNEQASKQMNLQEWHQWNRDTQNRVREAREEKKRWQTSVYREISITFWCSSFVNCTQHINKYTQTLDAQTHRQASKSTHMCDYMLHSTRSR